MEEFRECFITSMRCTCKSQDVRVLFPCHGGISVALIFHISVLHTANSLLRAFVNLKPMNIARRRDIWDARRAAVRAHALYALMRGQGSLCMNCAICNHDDIVHYLKVATVVTSAMRKRGFIYYHVTQ